MDVNKKSSYLGLLAGSLFVAAYYSVLRVLVSRWSESPEYSHAFLTVPIILYMAWGKKEELAGESITITWPGLVLVGISTLLYLFSLFTEVRTFIAVSMYVTLVGTLIYLAGMRSIRTLFTPLLLLLMLIPVPEQLYPQLTAPLQIQVSKAAEQIISLLGIPLLREGNIMNLPDHSFEVVEACSGLRSLITLMTLSVILGFFTLKKSLSKIILFVTSIPTAILINIVRVCAMILMYHYFNLDLTRGVLHTISGLLVFLLALLILFIVQSVLARLEA